MRVLWSSPCSRCGASPDGKPFPCLRAGWGARSCPMNAVHAQGLRQRESEMYRMGYGYGAWVVRKGPLGLSPICSLVFFPAKPTPEDLRDLYGDDLLHIADAAPDCPANEDQPLDLEVRADAAD